MNVDNINRLIEAVPLFEGFNMERHATCLCAVAARLEGRVTSHAGNYNGEDLLRFIGFDPGTEEGRNMRTRLVCALGSEHEKLMSLEKITVADAVAMLKHLRDTGEVRWA